MHTIVKKEYLLSQPDSAVYFSQILYDTALATNQEKYMAEALNNQGIAFYLKGDYDKAIDCYNKSLKIRKKIGDKNGVAKSLNNIGLVNRVRSKYFDAINYYNQSLKIKKEVGDKKGIASTLNNIGSIHQIQGNYDQAIEHYSKSRKISEAVGNKKGVAKSLNNIGLINVTFKNFQRGIEFYEKSLKIKEELGDKKGVTSSLMNIGSAYAQKEEYKKAIEYFNKSLKIQEKLGDKKGIAASYNNLGRAYKYLGQFDKAYDYFVKGLSIRKQIDDKVGIALSLMSIGKINLKKNNYQLALDQSSNALEIARKAGALPETQKAAELLWKINKKLGNFKEALIMYERYIQTRDTLESEENQKSVIRQQFKYQYEKQATADSVKAAERAKVKDAELTAEKAENKRHQIEAQQQRQQKYFLYSGLSVALIFGAFIFNRFRLTKRQNGIIEKQKDQVGEAYTKLEEKNTEILDSITYAKRIQSAILPPEKMVEEHLWNSFVFYKPKDIVAGDFYWMEPTPEGVLFAACDCTGHGVPGAMVSVVCNNSLNRSVREFGLREPGEILDKTRELVIQEFIKSEEVVKDGMDVAICKLKGNTLQYAGAHNPLWIIRKGASEIEQIKANKQPIGEFENPLPFSTHSVNLNPGDSIYLFSDGFSDQFGGEKGKKFKAVNFKKLLLSIQEEPMQQQRRLLKEAFENWKGDIEQLDDVCVIGVQV